jgi:hypothetical protein
MKQEKKATRRWVTLGLLVAAPFAVLVACSSSSSSNGGNPDGGPGGGGTAAACAACKVNTDCVAGFACSGSVCTKQCNVDMDCAGVGPASCDEGVCGCKGHTTPICGACTSTTDCVAGARCLLGTCKPETTQSTCNATNTCKAPLVCDPNLGCICSPEGGVDAGQGAGTGIVTVLCQATANDAGPPTAFSTCAGSAVFESGFPPGTGYTVTTTAVSASITELAYAGNVAAVPTALSAGEISVMGPGSTLNMSPDSKNVYAATSALPLGNVGDALKISAAGAAIPAFSSMVALPAIATLTSPIQPVAGGALVVDHTMPLTVIASSATDGKVVVVLTSVKSASSFVVLRGEGQIMGGSGGITIPASALALLPVGAGGTIQLFMANDATVMAGGTPVKVTVASRIYDGNGDPVFASTPLTMQ